MEITVRKAEKRDVPRIRELLVQVCYVHHLGRPDIFRSGGAAKYSKEELLLLLSDESRPIFVAVNGEDEVVGYAFCILSDAAADILTPIRTLYIDDLCADERLRRQGIGQKLFDHVRAFAAEKGCYHLTLNVWELNKGAKKFYERQGMKVLKQEMEVLL